MTGWSAEGGWSSELVGKTGSGLLTEDLDGLPRVARGVAAWPVEVEGWTLGSAGSTVLAEDLVVLP